MELTGPTGAPPATHKRPARKRYSINQEDIRASIVRGVAASMRRPSHSDEPHAAGVVLEIEQPARLRFFAPPKIRGRRNAPCPCNSGKKFKRCCGAA